METENIESVISEFLFQNLSSYNDCLGFKEMIQEEYGVDDNEDFEIMWNDLYCSAKDPNY